MTLDLHTCQSPVDLAKWIEANSSDFKPPVGNKYLYDGKDFFVMVVGGPNARNDFHVTDSEEYFFQLKGDMVVIIRDDNGIAVFTAAYMVSFIFETCESVTVPPAVLLRPVHIP